MTVWLLALALGVAAAFWMSRLPTRAGGTPRNEEKERVMAVLREQLEELRRDVRNGEVSAEEAATAEKELQRRALRARKALGGSTGLAGAPPVRGLGLATAPLLLIGSLGLYAALGQPAMQDRPLAARKAATAAREAAANPMAGRIAILRDQLAQSPNDASIALALGEAYSAGGDHRKAEETLRKALEANPDDAPLTVALAESLLVLNGRRVSPEAKALLEKAAAATNDPRARYYLAAGKAQEHDFEGAIADWKALIADQPPDAPWAQLARRDLVMAAQILKRDPKSVLPDATEDEIAAAEQALDPSARLRALEKRLAENPKDYQGWGELAQLKAAQGDLEGAKAAIAAGKQVYANAPFVAMQFDQLAQQLGLGAVESETAAGDVRGPSAEDMAQAAQMSQEDRDQMIRDMVDGLAARLEDEPDNLSGWVMLVRSYAVLGETDKAAASGAKAKELFAEDAAALAQLDAVADQFGLTFKK